MGFIISKHANGRKAAPGCCLLAASIAAVFGAAPASAQTQNEMRTTFRDGLRFESADKQHSFGLVGRVHFDYRSFSPSNTIADDFDVRRARLGFNGKVFENITFEVVGNFSPTSSLDVGWINYAHFGKAAQIRLGQFKMPFGQEALMSSNNITFQERAYIDNIAPNKQRGLMLHGVPINGMSYALAVSNGAGQNNSESDPANDRKELVGRLSLNVLEMLGNKDATGHLGVAYSNTTQPAGPLTPGIRTEGRGATFFTGTTPGFKFDRKLMGLEAAFATGPFKVQGEWANAEYAAGAAAKSELQTYYVYAAWAITGESFAKTYRDGVFGGIRPNKNFGKDGGIGALVLGVRYDVFDAGDFRAGTFTGTRKADAITVGLNWHLTSTARFMLNYVLTDYETPVTVAGLPRKDERAVTLRAQINF